MAAASQSASNEERIDELRIALQAAAALLSVRPAVAVNLLIKASEDPSAEICRVAGTPEAPCDVLGRVGGCRRARALTMHSGGHPQSRSCGGISAGLHVSVRCQACNRACPRVPQGRPMNIFLCMGVFSPPRAAALCGDCALSTGLEFATPEWERACLEQNQPTQATTEQSLCERGSQR